MAEDSDQPTDCILEDLVNGTNQSKHIKIGLNMSIMEAVNILRNIFDVLKKDILDISAKIS